MPNTPTEPVGTLSPALPAWLIPLSQLADSAAPTGGFSHSLGLETYVADGVVHDEPTFVGWLSAMLGGPLTTGDALAIRLIGAALEADPDDLAAVWRIDRLLHAQALPRQVRDATVAMGGRMLAIATLVAPSPWLTAYAGRIEAGACHGHPAVAIALAGYRLGAPAEVLISVHLQGLATTLTQNAVRLIPLGQNAGQRALAAVRRSVQDAAERTAALTELDFGATLPGLEIAQLRHERLRARMYMS